VSDWAGLLPVAVYVTDENGFITDYNEEAASLWGRKPVLGQDRWCGSWEIADLSGARVLHEDCPMALSIKGKKPLRGHKIMVKRQDGTHAFVAPHPTPIRNEKGDLVGAVNVLIDITDMQSENIQVLAERRAMEEQVERFSTQIAHVQRMEAIGQIASGMAHDFNNVLQGIDTGLAALDRYVAGEEGKALLQELRRGIERGGHLTRRLLEFMRHDQTGGTEADVAGVLERIRPLIERSMGGLIGVGISVPDEPLCAAVDPSRLEVALINLAINARDAMPTGGFLTIQASSRLIAPSPKLPGVLPSPPCHPDEVAFGEYVVVSVMDTGTGMPPEVLERVREPFFTTKEAGKGTGLGLSMVHEFANQAGGCLDIRSEVGRGTTASIFLPSVLEPVRRKVHSDEPPRVPEIVRQGPAGGDGRVVLLVDDDDMIRSGAAGVLESFGYRVVESPTAEEALDILRSGTGIDVLVTDHAMPGMSGAELVEAMRRLFPDMPALIMTGYTEQPFKADGVAFLQKPFQVEELVARLESITEESHEADH
jgi:PAS domain S-box-containing protein